MSEVFQFHGHARRKPLVLYKPSGRACAPAGCPSSGSQTARRRRRRRLSSRTAPVARRPGCGPGRSRSTCGAATADNAFLTSITHARSAHADARRPAILVQNMPRACRTWCDDEASSRIQQHTHGALNDQSSCLHAQCSTTHRSVRSHAQKIHISAFYQDFVKHTTPVSYRMRPLLLQDAHRQSTQNSPTLKAVAPTVSITYSLMNCGP